MLITIIITGIKLIKYIILIMDNKRRKTLDSTDDIISNLWKRGKSNDNKRKSFTGFFTESDEHDRNEYEVCLLDKTKDYDAMKNCCVCMIDIVGFSSWCKYRKPHEIATSMILYNELISSLICKYTNIVKIELVGDCCMLICIDPCTRTNCSTMILFGIDMILCMQKDINRIFVSNKIGVRIGIHLSDLIGIYIDDPLKYQLFGNDINICSRLESSTICNTLHISHKTIKYVNEKVYNSTCIKGPLIQQQYKGVGIKSSHILFLKKNKNLLINFDSISYFAFLGFLNLEVSYFSEQFFHNYMYETICINLVNTDFVNINTILMNFSNQFQCIGIPPLKERNLILLCRNSQQTMYIKSNFPIYDGCYLIVQDNHYRTNASYMFRNSTTKSILFNPWPYK
jgi:class 3 adenylate cyclase